MDQYNCSLFPFVLHYIANHDIDHDSMNNTFTCSTPRKLPKLSAFEQLPTEIIQIIFDCSNNISLPLSSLVFSRQLSAQPIYVRFAAELLYASPLDDDVGEPSRHSAAAVSRMLQCRWMSWEIFKAAALECFSRAKRNLAIQDEHESFNRIAMPPPFTQPHSRFRTSSYLSITPQTQIPTQLLRAPFSPSKTSFLHFLVGQSAGIDWTSSSRGESATVGLISAIAARNRTAVAALLAPNLGIAPSAAALRVAVVEHGCDRTIVFHLLAAALRALISQRGCASAANAADTPASAEAHENAHANANANVDSLTDVSFRAPELWSWAQRMTAAHREDGRWLTDALRWAEDARLANSVFDEQLYGDFARVSGRESDGVFKVHVPVVALGMQREREESDGDQDEGEGAAV